MLEFGDEVFRRVVENAPNALIVAVIDSQREIRYESPSLERALGYQPQELIGRNIAEFIHPEDLAGANDVLGVARQEVGVPMCAEFRFRHKDGSWRHLEAVGKALEQEPRVYTVLTCRDITERKRAEQVLALYAELVESSDDAIIGKTLDGIITTWNAGAERIYGYSKAEAVGQPVTMLVPADRLAELARIMKQLEQGARVENLETVRVRKDGIAIHLSITVSPIVDASGNILGASTIARDITERVRAQEKIERQVQRLNALRSIDLATSSSFDLGVTLDVLLTQVTIQLGVDAADILLLNPHLQRLEFAAKQGFHSTALEQTRLRLGEGYAGLAALERHLISVSDLRTAQADLAKYLERAGERFVSYYAVPLIARGEVRGVMEVFHRTPLAPDREWLDFLETVANQAAIAIENLSLFEALQRSNTELAVAYDSTLEGWSRALELRDRKLEGHTQRVTEMSVRLARRMGLAGADLVQIRRGALLHDIGKMGVPDRILLKEDALTEEEWAIMRQHPVYAYELLAPIAFLRPALDIPFCHHEKWDGSGYPRGLKGEQIPLSARIFAVVDVWDALRSERPYRQAWSEEQVQDYLLAQSEKHFDPEVVEKFTELLAGGISS
jgi:PAS domain S-box-containing protein/putative nucleotidyltransferase with HDIG domain